MAWVAMPETQAASSQGKGGNSSSLWLERFVMRGTLSETVQVLDA